MSGPTDPAEAHFDKGLWGWDGTQWRKLPMLWGYSDRYVEKEVDASADVGLNYLVFSTVPAGEIWVISSVVWANLISACSTITAQLYDGAEAYAVFVETPSVADVYKATLCNLVLKAGDNLRVDFSGCTAGDVLLAFASGYKMAIAE